MADTWEAIVASLVNDLDQSLAGRYSAVLYGSAARGDWVAGVSDINLLLVLDDTAPASLRGLTQPFAELAQERQCAAAGAEPRGVGRRRRRVSDRGDRHPSRLQGAEGCRSGRGHAGVASRPPHPAGARVPRQARFSCGAATWRSPTSGRHWRSLARPASRPSCCCSAPCWRCWAGPVPRGIEAVVQEASIAVGAHPSAQLEFVRHRADQKWMATREQFESYLAAVETAARFVNHLQLGAGS